MNPTLIDTGLFLLGTILAKGAIFIAFGWLVNKYLVSRSAGVRHLLWTLTFLCVLLLPTGFILPSLDLPIFPAAYSEPTAGAVIIPAETATNVSAISGESVFPWKAVPILLWLTGILFFITRLTWQTVRRKKQAAGATIVTAPEWQILLQELKSEINLQRSVRLFFWNKKGIPMTWGVLRPVILLPADAVDWPDARRRMVLLHELAHIKRFDILTQRVAQYACAFHWCNPFMWRALDALVIEGEHACDDIVLSLGIRPTTYAEYLLTLAQKLFHIPIHAKYAVTMAHTSELKARIKALLHVGRDRSCINRSSIARSMVLFTLLFIFVAPVHLTESRQAAAEPPNTSPEMTVEPSETNDDPGRIAGTVVYAETDEPLPMVNIEIVDEDQRLGAASDLEGRYFIDNVDPGTYTVRAFFVGMHVMIQEGVVVESGKTTALNFSLTRQSGSTDPSSPEEAERIRIARRIDAVRTRLGEESPKPAIPISTGKITGSITDARTGEPLPGANIRVMGTQLGVASDIEGKFYIIDLLPGVYTIRADFVGFESMEQLDVRVVVGETTTIHFPLLRSQ